MLVFGTIRNYILFVLVIHTLSALPFRLNGDNKPSNSTQMLHFKGELYEASRTH